MKALISAHEAVLFLTSQKKPQMRIPRSRWSANIRFVEYVLHFEAWVVHKVQGVEEVSSYV